MEWQMAEAKNTFSEIVTRALHEGPHCARRHGGVGSVVEEMILKAGWRTMVNEGLCLDRTPISGVDMNRDENPSSGVDR